MKIKYIIVNGPRNAGKSTLAREMAGELRSLGKRVVTDSFFAPVRHFFAAIHAEPYKSMNHLAPQPTLSGYCISDCVDWLVMDCRERYGADCFARWLAHRHLKHPHKIPEYVIVDDGCAGADIMCMDNRFLVRLVRPGFGWSMTDYWPNPDHTFENVGPPVVLWGAAKAIARTVLDHEAF